MTKNELVQYAEDHKEELLKLVSDLIQIKSENPTGSQRGVIDYVKNYMTAADIACEETDYSATFPCLVGKIGQEGGFNLIFNGHVDVVPAGDLSKWDFDPFSGTITDTQILGRGTSDMKAGVAGALFAAALFSKQKIKLNGSIRIHIVSDEESGGEGTKWLCENGYSDHADACIVAEPTSMDTIEIGQKGGLLLILKARGESAHGSLGNFKGDNAILKLSKVLARIDQLMTVKGHYTERQEKPLRDSQMLAEKENNLPGIGHVINSVTTNVGLISGGTRHNMVPDYCEATVDVRLPIGVDKSEIEAKLKSIIAESGVDGIEYELNYKIYANFTDHEAPIVLAVKHNAESFTGKPVVPAYQWASSDARDYRKLGIPTIQFGPSNTVGIHSYNETVQIEDVVIATKTYIASICDLMGIQ